MLHVGQTDFSESIPFDHSLRSKVAAALDEVGQEQVYVLYLERDLYYVGNTNNLAGRLRMHLSSTGASLTMFAKPLRLVDLAPGGIDAESEKTLEWMEKIGWWKVRGGRWTGVVKEGLPDRVLFGNPLDMERILNMTQIELEMAVQALCWNDFGFSRLRRMPRYVFDAEAAAVQKLVDLGISHDDAQRVMVQAAQKIMQCENANQHDLARMLYCADVLDRLRAILIVFHDVVWPQGRSARP